jgi:hypothetical protein
VPHAALSGVPISFAATRPGSSPFSSGTGKAEEYIGREITGEGWCRRGLTPYIEMSKLTGENGKSSRLYSRWIQSLTAVFFAIGWLWPTGSRGLSWPLAIC